MGERAFDQIEKDMNKKGKPIELTHNNERTKSGGGEGGGGGRVAHLRTLTHTHIH